MMLVEKDLKIKTGWNDFLFLHNYIQFSAVIFLKNVLKGKKRVLQYNSPVTRTARSRLCDNVSHMVA